MGEMWFSEVRTIHYVSSFLQALLSLEGGGGGGLRAREIHSLKLLIRTYSTVRQCLAISQFWFVI